MSDTPIAPTEFPNTAPPGEAKPTAQDNTRNTRPLPEAPKQK
jgi:hypothetical protein